MKINFHRLLEFFVVGLVLGVTEDMIAITLATDKVIDMKVFLIAFFVALPFAVFSELIVDHAKFREFLKRRFKKENH